ncbi:hypothetical protein [Deinococcus daejeonensis]|uniref:Uncharacterized protein n=1 Tax=Deinococcus daejeonensis TaxID=1007098 RepID=A0ABQ2JJL9_9DEIO|nr:hypothetical protein [Deinococcus daejeonensis]GGN46559.1 hypothetical protein GCM10010842_37220 [Deinococcus daejeonensis]
MDLNAPHGEITANLEHPEQIRTAIHAYLNQNPAVAHLYRTLLQERDASRTTLLLFTIAVTLGYPTDHVLEQVLADLDDHYQNTVGMLPDNPVTELILEDATLRSREHKVLLRGRITHVTEHGLPSTYQPGQEFEGIISSTSQGRYVLHTPLRTYQAHVRADEKPPGGKRSKTRH